MRVLLFFLLYIVAVVNIQAQSVTVFGTNSDSYPIIKAYFYAKDSQGVPVTTITNSSVNVTENGVKQKILNVTCSSEGSLKNISSVLVMDISNSMASGNPVKNIDIAKAGAQAWINSLPKEGSECALTSYNNKSYLDQDFTSDKQLLTDALNKLQPKGSTNYNAAFISGVGASLNIAARAKYKPVIVFLTDGQGTMNEQEILLRAASLNAVIYCVGLNVTLPTSLKNIVKQTKGDFFENVSTIKGIEEIYERILQSSFLMPPCELTWKTDISCTQNRSADIEFTAPVIKTTVEYSVPYKDFPKISLSSISERFTSTLPGKSDSTEIIITAETDSVEITSITSSDSSFIIDDSIPPSWKLNRGETKTIKLIFRPRDSSLVYGTINIFGKQCQANSIYVVGGFLKTIKPEAKLRIISPNGKESFPVGDTTTIRWSGVLPSDAVQLDYSTDSGVSWQPISNKATGLSYLWNIPPAPSNRCLLRVQQFVKTNTDSILVLIGHTDKVNGACFSPDGLQAVTVSDDKTFKIWNALNGKPIPTPFIIQGNKPGYCVDWSPDGQYIAIGGELYDANIFTYIRSLTKTSLSGSTYSCAFTKDSKFVVSTGDADHNYLLVSDLQAASYESLPSPHISYISRLSIGPSATDHITVLTSSQDRSSIRTEINLTPGAPSTSRPYIDLQNVDYSVAYVANQTSPGIYCSGIRNGLLQFFPSLSPLELFKNDAITDIEWSPDGKFIAVALNSGKLAIVDVGAQLVVRELDSIHTSAVSIRWDSYSSRVIASYVNNLALIWDIGKHIFQEDESDAEWKIVSPVISSIKDIYLGSVSVNSSRDSIVQSVLCLSQNPLSASRIDAAEILNDADGAFRIISGVPADFSNVLKACLPVELEFSPKKTGLATATLRLYSNKQIFDISLTGEGFDLNFTYPEFVIDFGKVPVGLSKDTLLNPSITNTINKYLDITTTSIGGPDTKQFYIISGDTTILLNYKDSTKLKLRFAPRTIGRTSSCVKIEFNRQDATTSSGSPVYITLFGEGLCGNDSTRTLNIGLGNAIPAKVGTIVELPIIMKLRPEQVLDIIQTRFYCVLSFDATMLKSIGLPPGEIVGNKRIMRLEGARDPFSDTLIKLPFLTLLGSDSVVTVHIDSIYLDDGGCPLGFRTDSVTVILTDLCVASGTTRLLAGSPVTKMVVLPNPITDRVNIQLTLAEESPISISVSDALGREYLVHETFSLERGIHDATFDCSLLPSGVYSLVLKTRSEVKLLQFVKQ